MADHPDSPLASNAGLRWAIGLVEPLLPPELRIQQELELGELCALNPAFAAAFFAGVCSDMVLTLPAADPWRHLSARIDTPTGTLTRGDRPPDTTGAVLPDGTTFGNLASVADIIEPVFNDHLIDVAVAAIAEPLAPEAAALIAFSADGWEQAVGAANAIHLTATDSNSDSGGVVLYRVGTTAVRWCVHRRRSYITADDAWPVESAWNWAWRAGKVAVGKPWAEADIEIALAQEQIIDNSVENL